MPQTIAVRAGQELRVRKMTVSVPGGVATVNGPPRRELVVLVLGTSDVGVPFDIVRMLDVLGFVPKKEEENAN